MESRARVGEVPACQAHPPPPTSFSDVFCLSRSLVIIFPHVPKEPEAEGHQSDLQQGSCLLFFHSPPVTDAADS